LKQDRILINLLSIYYQITLPHRFDKTNRLSQMRKSSHKAEAACCFAVVLACCGNEKPAFDSIFHVFFASRRNGN